jgi:hypothetical protein
VFGSLFFGKLHQIVGIELPELLTVAGLSPDHEWNIVHYSRLDRERMDSGVIMPGNVSCFVQLIFRQFPRRLFARIVSDDITAGFVN